MEQIGTKIEKLKKMLLFSVILLTMLGLSFFIEIQVNKFQVDPAVKIISSQGKEDKLGVSYSPNADGSELVKFSANSNSLPTYFRANDNLTMTAFEDAFITMSQGTELRTLIFTKKKLHLQLIKGEAILDNRLSQNPVTIQVDNVMIKPYQKGVFYISKNETTTLQSVYGQAQIGVYSKQGKLLSTTLLPRSNSYTFTKEASSQIKPSPEPNQPAFYLASAEQNILADIQAKLDAKQLLHLQYKNRNIDPSDSSNFMPNLTQALTINSKKRNYLKLYSFAEQLKFAEASLLAGDISQGAIGIAEAKRTFSDQTSSSPSSLDTFKQFLQEIYSYYIALTPEQDLNSLKVYITDNHLNLLDSKYAKLAILSYIEDLFVDYARGRDTEAEVILDKITQLISKVNLDEDDSINLIAMIDNILIQHPKSNNASTYKLRSSLGDSLESKEDYQDSSAAHLQRLQTYFDTQAIANQDIQESVAILINQVSTFDRLQYEDFFDEVSKAAL